MGLRETKKQRTRTAIADTASALFLEHGFDRVTVAEVARHAGVSTNTVFNYFPAKEDLFFDRQALAEDLLAAPVRRLPPGGCPVEAVRDDLLGGLRRSDPMLGLHPGAPRFRQVVQDSPALRAREREIGEHAEEALARALAGLPDGAAPPGAALLAGALAGTHRAALREIREGVLAGRSPAQVRDALVPAVREAFDRLCHGLHPRTAAPEA
ncbi:MULTISPECIES: TetR/AcrR family transcriptional regulator [unclassified Streptomyces]|uniref:TetR/AcrR family transcriptional regulator n=1 Tax=unclassified Streptomyces TaxID=2593676 RepID=UPI00223809A0|nr:TetR/AcrR family transcriptional regulator [Streptomyces sp. SHP 1-2]MCW5253622.1 TetR/AcrR family transcriptional regulator [Streptomyces sp. SHP 1-2]